MVYTPFTGGYSWMMRVAILQARMSSKRLPGKVMRPLFGAPMIIRQLERIRAARLPDKIVVATSTDPSDDPLAAMCAESGQEVFRGSLEDVLDRFYRAANGAGTVVRLTGDCPLIDPEVLDKVISAFDASDCDYFSNVHPPTFPDGLDVEVMRFGALERAWKEAHDPFEREHVTPFLYRSGLFKAGNFQNDRDLSALRWTVDNEDDLALVDRIFTALYPVNPRFGMHEVFALLEKNPEWAKLNQHFARNYGLESKK